MSYDRLTLNKTCERFQKPRLSYSINGKQKHTVYLKLMVTIFLSLHDQYEKDGYLVIEDVFDTDKLRKLFEAANEFVSR